MKTIILLATLAVAPVFTPGDSYTLKYKVKKGDSWSYVMDMDMDMTIGIDMMTGQPSPDGGMDMDMGFRVYSNMSISDAEKTSFVMANTVDSMIMEMTMPGMGKISMNTNQVDENDPMGMMMMEGFKGVLGQPILTTMDQLGNVTDVVIPESFGGGGAMGGSTNPIEGMQMMMGLFPESEVAVGDTWQKTTSMTTSGITMDLANTFTLVSADKKTAKIKFEGTMVMPNQDMNDAIRERIEEEGEEVDEEALEELDMSMDMAGVVKGTIVLDMSTGMTKTSAYTMTATMTMDMMGQQVPMEIDGSFSLAQL